MIAIATLEHLKIGEVAACSGIPVKTIRYYEELGLLSPVVHRSRSKYRLFDKSIYNRLAFIKRAQALGLSLKEIKEILAVRDAGHLPCGVVKQTLLLKLREIDRQMKALEMLRLELQEILSGWQDMPDRESIDRTICPNIQLDL